MDDYRSSSGFVGSVGQRQRRRRRRQRRRQCRDSGNINKQPNIEKSDGCELLVLYKSCFSSSCRLDNECLMVIKIV